MVLDKYDIEKVLGKRETQKVMQSIVNFNKIGYKFKIGQKGVYIKKLVPKTKKIADFYVHIRTLDIDDAIKKYEQISNKEQYEKYKTVHKRVLNQLKKVKKHHLIKV